MCLIVVAVDQHPDYPLILLANRDEYYHRSSAALHHWEGHPDLLAGRDLEQGGTWAAWHLSGRFAALTNVRRPEALYPGLRSRGEIPVAFVSRSESPAEFAQQLVSKAGAYAPFNLLYGTLEQLYYLSSDNLRPVPLTRGFHGLSNAGLDDPWPKVVYVQNSLQEYLARPGRIRRDDLFDIMTWQEGFPDKDLPDTGVPLDWERILAPPFIVSDAYGTRSTMLLLVDQSGDVQLSERVYHGSSGPDCFSERTFVLSR
ncbi:MAG: hypothetical protein C0624_02020 [Desulfuromonas sp.]|nr:MAG: hypothetical protein C0624_02020 [Desulfuromonas sp.]